MSHRISIIRNLRAYLPHRHQWKDLIKLAIEKSVQEWISPVIERAIKIAITTCEQIVKKDFSLDFDETRMRVAAHHMVRNLTAGMAMITCRDHLLLSIKNNLKNIMMTLGRNLLPGQVDAIDVTVSVIANDNVELACAFIQKKAVEKAEKLVDERSSTLQHGLGTPRSTHEQHTALMDSHQEPVMTQAALVNTAAAAQTGSAAGAT